jgi:hypothetical protein
MMRKSLYVTTLDAGGSSTVNGHWNSTVTQRATRMNNHLQMMMQMFVVHAGGLSTTRDNSLNFLSMLTTINEILNVDVLSSPFIH